MEEIKTLQVVTAVLIGIGPVVANPDKESAMPVWDDAFGLSVPLSEFFVRGA